MDTRVVAEIEAIREELSEIDQRRRGLPEGERAPDDLLEREHELESRLVELEDRGSEAVTGEAEKTAADQTDLTRSPRLPDDDA